MTNIERREYSDDTRTVKIYDGLEFVSRPYTTEENAEADVKAAKVVVETTLKTDAFTSIAQLMSSIDALKAITDKANADLGPSDTKSVARESRKVARQVIRLTRLMLKVLDTSNVGTE